MLYHMNNAFWNTVLDICRCAFNVYFSYHIDYSIGSSKLQSVSIRRLFDHKCFFPVFLFSFGNLNKEDIYSKSQIMRCFLETLIYSYSVQRLNHENMNTTSFQATRFETQRNDILQKRNLTIVPLSTSTLAEWFWNWGIPKFVLKKYKFFHENIPR